MSLNSSPLLLFCIPNKVCCTTISNSSSRCAILKEILCNRFHNTDKIINYVFYSKIESKKRNHKLLTFNEMMSSRNDENTAGSFSELLHSGKGPRIMSKN